MSCYLESKSSGAFNFIETFVLKLCTKSRNRIIKMMQNVTRVQNVEKMKYKLKPFDYM